MKDSVIILLRALLIMIFMGTVLGQTIVVPTLAAESATLFPEVAGLAVPYAALVIGGIFCLQAMLVATWILLSHVQRDVIFSPDSLRWATVIIWAAAAATTLALILGIHLFGVVRTGGPGVLLLVGGTVICGTAFVLLMSVMRDLLRSATRLDSELAEVV